MHSTPREGFGELTERAGVFDEWQQSGTGPLSTNGIEAGVKIRPTPEELKEFESWPTPHFKSGWESYFKNKPDKPVMHYSVISGWFGDHMLMPPGKFFTMFHFRKSSMIFPPLSVYLHTAPC